MAASRICKIEDCGKPHYGHGYCKGHHRRLRLYGDPLASRKRPKLSCAVADCGKEVRGHGYCTKHYKRWVKFGDPLVKRYAAKGEPGKWIAAHKGHDGDNCLIWPFGRDGNGYAGLVEYDGRRDRAHRLMCRAVHGEPPAPDHHAAHSCGKGHLGCVNPNHLSWKTPVENEADRLVHGTHNRGERCGTSKLKEWQVLQIRAVAGAICREELADHFNVHPGTIKSIMARHTWAWLK